MPNDRGSGIELIVLITDQVQIMSKYSRLSLSRTRLSGITTYLEVNI